MVPLGSTQLTMSLKHYKFYQNLKDICFYSHLAMSGCCETPNTNDCSGAPILSALRQSSVFALRYIVIFSMQLSPCN